MDNINNQYDFFKTIQLDENGNILAELNLKVGNSSKAVNQFEFYKKIKLSDNGYLNLYENK